MKKPISHVKKITGKWAYKRGFSDETDNFLLHDNLNAFVDTISGNFQDDDTLYIRQEYGAGSIEFVLTKGLACCVEGGNIEFVRSLGTVHADDHHATLALQQTYSLAIALGIVDATDTSRSIAVNFVSTETWTCCSTHVDVEAVADGCEINATIGRFGNRCTSCNQRVGRLVLQFCEGGVRNLAVFVALTDEFFMVGNADEVLGVCLLELTGCSGQSRKRFINLEATVFALLAMLRSLVRILVGTSIVVDSDTVGQLNNVTTGNRFIDTIAVSFLLYALERHTRTVVQDDVASIVVLVEALSFVTDSETAIQNNIHRPLVATALKSVTVTSANSIQVKETVLVGDTVVKDDRHVVAEPTFFLIEYIPSVVAVQPCATTVEVVAVTNGEFRCETVGIAFTFVAVQIRVAVDDIVVCTEVLDLQTRVAVLVEVTLLDDVVMAVLCAVDDVAGRAACRLVALDKHTVVAGVGDVDLVEVPERAGVTDTLLWVVTVSVVWHAREVEDGVLLGVLRIDEHLNELVSFTVAVVDVDALVVDVCASLHPDAVAGLCDVDSLLQVVERLRLATVGGGIVTVG